MIFQNKRIVVTGGTGSLGKVLVRRILSGEEGLPAAVTVFSRDEGKQHEMRLQYLHKEVSTDEVIFNNFKNLLKFVIGDVRDYSDVCSVLRDADIVINAAALKQVPTCEYFPEQAVLTNCMGAYNITRAIREHGYSVDTIVGVSTDKAAKPVNAMGMTKAIQERIFIAANVLSEKTRFISVRYGNVLASRGSVIPLFHEQLKYGKPLTITHPDMTRFLMSLNHAVDTVFNAIAHAFPGEIFVPDAPSSNIINIAKALIGDRSNEIKIVGVRPGEKMHELLISEEECHHTSRRGDYYAVHPMLPELQDRGGKIVPALEKELSSEDNILSLEKTIELLKHHGLLPGQKLSIDDSEMLA
ncbi:MAG: polysaccharide biosynthesis protein [Legionellales bacterium]|nr:polysaccharide biosynthesis protein [Legionellales bacterium]